MVVQPMWQAKYVVQARPLCNDPIEKHVPIISFQTLGTTSPRKQMENFVVEVGKKAIDNNSYGDLKESSLDYHSSVVDRFC